MVWVEDAENNGWGCSNCAWQLLVPSFLGEAEARLAYDRLAFAQFREHACEIDAFSRQIAESTNEPIFVERVRKLLGLGYKPRDAVELAIGEVELEHRNDPQIVAQARAEGEDLLRRIRAGAI
jgi:hypothetical protein